MNLKNIPTHVLLFIYYYSLEYSGFYLFRDLVLSYRDRLPATVLAYHRVNDAIKNSLTISTKQFDNQMRILSKRYNVISLKELVIKLRNREKFKRRTVAITFDDGYEDNYINAAPILRKYNLLACFFVTVGYIGTDKWFPWDTKWQEDSRVMTWNHLNRLVEMGFEIGSHTFSHPNLRKAPEETARKELSASRAELEKRLQTQIDLFAYPFGGLDDIPKGFEELLNKAGFICCCSASGLRVHPSADPYMIHRVPINERFGSIPSFCLEINGGRKIVSNLKKLFVGK